MENDRQTDPEPLALVVETKKKRFRSFVLREKKVVFCVFRETQLLSRGKHPKSFRRRRRERRKDERERERESLGRKALVGEKKKKKKKKKRFALSLFVSFDDDVQQRR